MLGTHPHHRPRSRPVVALAGLGAGLVALAIGVGVMPGSGVGTAAAENDAGSAVHAAAAPPPLQIEEQRFPSTSPVSCPRTQLVPPNAIVQSYDNSQVKFYLMTGHAHSAVSSTTAGSGSMLVLHHGPETRRGVYQFGMPTLEPLQPGQTRYHPQIVAFMARSCTYTVDAYGKLNQLLVDRPSTAGMVYPPVGRSVRLIGGASVVTKAFTPNPGRGAYSARFEQHNPNRSVQCLSTTLQVPITQTGPTSILRSPLSVTSGRCK